MPRILPIGNTTGLKSRELEFQRHLKVLGCRPDFVFSNEKLAMFVDGCQWHGCPEHYVRPRTRGEFWSAKLLVNVNRDLATSIRLEENGWTALRFWEHEVDTQLEIVIGVVERLLRGEGVLLEPRWVVWKVASVGTEGRMERRHLRRFDDVDVERIVEGPRKTTKWRRARRSR